MKTRIVHLDFDNDNYILRDHKVYDVSIIPGVTYLDLILRSAKAIFDQDFQLSRVLFTEPLATTKEYNRKLEITYQEGKGSAYEAVLRSQKMNHKGETFGPWTEHMHCRLDALEKQDEVLFDVRGFIANSEHVYDVEEVYARTRKAEISHGEFMQAKGRIYQKGDEELMALHLSELAEEYREQLMAHPAFLDGSTFAGMSFGLQEGQGMFGEGIPFIPFSIDHFEIRHSFPSTVYVYSQKQVLPANKLPEVIKNDITLYNENGQLLARFRGLTSKRIRHPELIRQLVEDAATPQQEQNPPSITNNSGTSTITNYLKEIIAAKLGKQISELDNTTGFYDLGLDSKKTMELVRELEVKCGHDFYPTLLFEYQTIEALSEYLLQEEAEHFKTESQESYVHKAPVQDYQSPSPYLPLFHYGLPEEPIAIIGLSGRFPGAGNVNEFWNNLQQGKNSIQEIPRDRWDIENFYTKEKGKDGKSYSKWGGFVEDADKFDPLFFNISPQEAENMDPQVRLFLEESWKTLEDGGYTPKKLAKEKVGVFAGVFWTDYQLFRAEVRTQSIFPSSFVSLAANTVSYHFGFEGPSIGLDTQCSSSLTAIHLACDSLRKRESTTALAGGVNLSLHPSKYNWLSNSMFLSSKGLCESFGEGGEGYVPAEGVGVILLKPLSNAEADGDQIYGVIRGTAVNHGGRSSGFTVPNPNAQAVVIKEAIKKAGVKAEDFSYIEAHGTGTSLGDPIEIAGLTKAFQSDKKQYCSIGSVKSNIGHGEAAAGMAGITKVLLQMKYKQLVPSLHSATLNPNIDFESSPFKVQQKLEAWTTENNEPRLAGVSSFGAGGSNAHIIIEEYRPTEREPYRNTAPAIVVLSGRNAESLKRQVVNLKNYLEANPDTPFHDIAYTLQIGREAMTERLAIVSKNQEELKTQLISFLEGKTDNLLRGNIKKDKSDFLLEGGAGQAYINYAIEQKENKSLAQLWVKGMFIDWHLLYGEHRPRKISLPTYPFARERYWIPLQDAHPALITGSAMLHPLLHNNTSNLNEQKYTSVYTGKEAFLTDHKVREEKIFPGVAYLELAREAGARSAEKGITRLTDVTWLSPIRVNGMPEKVDIGIYASGEEIAYDVYTQKDGQEQVHSQGRLSTTPRQAPERQDLELIRNRLKNTKEREACYELFKGMGLDYGKSFQGIEILYYSEAEALSRISLLKEKDYILAPGLLDSALQTCAGLSFVKEKPGLTLPFSVKEVTIYKDLQATIWCYARKSANNKANGKVISYDIDLLNEEGEILLSFRDFVMLPLDNISKNRFTHLYSNGWQLSELTTNSYEETNTTQLVLLAGGADSLADKLTETLEMEVVAIPLQSTATYFMSVLNKIKEKLRERNPTHITVVCQNSDYLDCGFVSGLLKTATWENPKLTGKIIGVDSLSVTELDTLTEILRAEQNSTEAEVRYQKGKREIKIAGSVSDTGTLSIKEGGVYLITGGAGGLGRIFAEHISKTKNTKLILTGRSELKESISEIPGAIYYRCDVSNKDEVFSLIKTIKEKYQKLDGIIHSAGVIRDSFIIKKTEEEVAEVLSPKIAGAQHLDEATKEEPLDFMVFFSSMAGVLGNTGQADYASANAYLDYYAHYRNEQKAKGLRYGKTLSINWPLWKEGGMQVDEETLKYLEKQWGMLPLPTEEGIAAFEALLRSTASQGIVAYGPGEKIKLALFHKDSTPPTEVSPKETSSSKSAIEVILIEICSALLKLNKEDLETDTEFSEYGVDSIMMMKILNMLESRFEIAIEPTAIVSYPTIALLAEYLEKEKSPAIKEPILATNPKASSVPGMLKRSGRARVGTSPKSNGKVAIIGMSCKLPESDNLDEYWENLRLGKDLISEMPANRWDASNYYSAEAAPDKSYTTKGGFLKNAGLFDTLYFKISDEEALSMDPQQRIILELTRDLLSHAGYRKEELSNTKTGVYIGAKDNNYVRNNYHLLPPGARQHTVVNNISNMIAARVSDFYNLKGTSQVIDTACSSSLVAIHQACDDILSGKTTMAIAGGISIMVDAFAHIGFSQAEVLSRDGRSYVFDERAAGFVMAEGGALVMLKDYNQALADGDQIVGVVAGSSVNNDGQTMGLTVPNKEGQKEVIRETLEKTKISPEEITYYEAHGTGTLLGDPIEIKAATEVYRTQTANRQYCAIGSVKSNLGHNMTAAGVTALIKILLQMQHSQLAPTLHCEKPHPRFKFEESPFYPNTTLKAWTTDKKIAALSSFGFGGTNCHMVIEKPTTNTSIKRTTLPVERLSNNSYWLGQEMTEHLKEEGQIKEIFYDEPLIRDHQIFGKQVLIGATYMVMSINEGFKLYPGKALRIDKILFSNPLVLEPGEMARLKSITDPASNQVNIEYQIDEKVSMPFNCKLNQIIIAKERINVDKLKKDSVKESEAKLFYDHKGQSCYGYGPTLRTVQNVWHLPNGDSLASLRISDEQMKKTETFIIPPALFDGAHVASTLSLYQDIEMSGNNHWPPLMIKAVEVMGDLPGYNLQDYYCYISPVKSNDQIAEFNIKILKNDGTTIVRMFGYTTKSVPDPASLFGTKAPQNSNPAGHVLSSHGNVEIGITGYLQIKIGEALSKQPSEISLVQNFMDMGLDSGQMIGISQLIEKELDIELYPTLFFEYQNIGDLVGYFKSDHADKLSATHPIHSPLSFGSENLTLEMDPSGQEEVSRKINTSRTDDIAVIGMSGYLPQSADLAEFWDHIQASRDLITEIPEDHWDYKPWFDENKEAENKTYCKWGGFLKDIDKFDPLFFGIAPLQATWMDPQLRLLLQSAYHTFEDAGVINEIRGSRTGVYVGSCFHEYWDEIVRAQTSISNYQHNSSAMSSLSASVSYHFDLRGGSIPLDNACASSMTALHLGCQAIRNGEIDTAVIGGLNVLLSPLHYVYFSRMQALSPTGRCHTFDKKADGYVPGEGVVSILIKPLSKAIADGNKIHGVIKGSAINHVGKSNNPTSPRPELQTELLVDAWKAAGINPENISYIEAHGTGTGLGDPIEINALKRAFKNYTDKTGFCAIGSTKAHTGHLEGAAGLTSVIKVLLMMKHKTIPAMPNFEELNPYIKIDGSPFRINKSTEHWKSDKPFMAGISSFGMTGNNAHVVIEEYQPKDIPAYSSSSPVIILLSARDKDRLKVLAGNLNTYLQSNPVANLHDIAYTLQTNREFMDERLALIAKDREELTVKLKAYLDGETNHLITGNVIRDKSDFSLNGKGEPAYMQKAVKAKELDSLAMLWVKGVSVDWTGLYLEDKPNKISLPMYPFARERYWIPKGKGKIAEKKKNLHPLLHKRELEFKS
ncbi:Acyl transferase domain-containing protein [Chitinophaga sp. CF118]|uniref:SDR family NAD(P)-dependent oxidoreductase n=1 Tax=Chitinophaga sp. CF118 TaxID=1884367 RepID=UPI0008F32282|nr:SDR family NAD(P)-dependent oxidoreductase [Chitinophaga sp. CF118]SFE51956.1 Acyl transferase domain-containing protein [Chitinophaga sp. CF118]